MPLIVELPQLARQAIQSEGVLTREELSLGDPDELLAWGSDLRYRVTITQVGEALRLEGWLEAELACCCARCLKPFRLPLRLDPWSLEVPLKGEGAAVIAGDLVDLTPFLREDTLLALPQHPLCDPGCGGLSSVPAPEPGGSGPDAESGGGNAVWTVLDRLKL